MFDGDAIPFVDERTLTFLGYVSAAVVLFLAGVIVNELWGSWGIEALGVAVSGVLTLALVGLYRRQTTIQETQTEIMGAQEEWMEFGYAPDVVIDSWTVHRKNEVLDVYLMNLGNGVAKELAVAIRVAPVPSGRIAAQVKRDEPDFSRSDVCQLQCEGRDYNSGVLNNSMERVQFRAEPTFSARDLDLPARVMEEGSFETISEWYNEQGMAGLLVYLKLMYRDQNGTSKSEVFYAVEVELSASGGLSLARALGGGKLVGSELDRTAPFEL